MEEVAPIRVPECNKYGYPGYTWDMENKVYLTKLPIVKLLEAYERDLEDLLQRHEFTKAINLTQKYMRGDYKPMAGPKYYNKHSSSFDWDVTKELLEELKSGADSEKVTGKTKSTLQAQREQDKEVQQQYEDLFKHELSEYSFDAHTSIKDVLVNINVGNLVFLVGPAGSGKTTIAMTVSDILELDFYFTGAVHQKHELLGFVDAKGEVVRTPFRDAYEKGGLFLFDEFDASSPNAITAFNAALANSKCAFPDKIADRHPDFVAIAAGNTYGTGASRQYVGRYQQDAASLDRFVFIEIDYDTNLEMKLAHDAFKEWGGKYDWMLNDYMESVIKIRGAIRELGISHIVSPRASIMGAKLIAQGVKRQNVDEYVIYKGMNLESRKQILMKLSNASSSK